MDIINIKRSRKKLKIALALCLVGFLGIFLVALATTDDFRESIGIICIGAGCDLVNPIPTLDWVYFVFPVAVLIYSITPPSVTRNESVVIAYVLSHVAGAILLLVGIALLGDSGRESAKIYLTYMLTSPLFILFMVFSVLFVMSMLYFNFKLKKKHRNG